jgi:hypothetical protein
MTSALHPDKSLMNCVTEKDNPGLPGPIPILAAIQSLSLRTKIPEYSTWADQMASDSRLNAFHTLSSRLETLLLSWH